MGTIGHLGRETRRCSPTTGHSFDRSDLIRGQA
jgi:hypothetical protein